LYENLSEICEKLTCIFKGRKRRLMREQIQQLSLDANGNPLPNAQGRNQENATAFLKKEELDAYFPVKNFQEIKKSFDQTSCSICLDEYNQQAVCRQLYCEHVFHTGCIEEWLAKHKVKILINFSPSYLFLGMS